MSKFPSKFVWYELMTNDTQAAEIFYKKVIGWDAKDAGMPTGPYTIVSAGTLMVGGIMALLIRTAERIGDTWRYGVGSGITWDSEPEAELAEVRLKLGALTG